MNKIIHDQYGKLYWLESEVKNSNDINSSEGLITIAQIKEIEKAIKVLNNNVNVKIYVSGGCIDVKPVDKDTEKIDAPIFREFEVVKLNNSTLNVLINGKEYKTASINDSYQYEGKTYYCNTIEEVIFKY
jgi:hypothetical protein